MSPQEIADKCVFPANEVRRLRAENAKLRRELSEAKDLRMLDMAEIVRLRRMLEVAIDG